MTLNECYASMGADYTGVMGRLMKEERVAKFLLKFKDSTDYQQMLDALEEKDWETAFRQSHNLKGVALNLGLTKLHKTSDILCESLRGGEPTEDISGMVADVKKAYELTVDAISQLQ